MFSQIVSTIGNSLKTKPFLYIIIVLTQAVLLVCVYFSYGIIYNAFTNYKNAPEKDRTFSARFIDLSDDTKTPEEILENAFTYREFKGSLYSIINSFGEMSYQMRIEGLLAFKDDYYLSSIYLDGIDGALSDFGEYDILANMDGVEVGDKIEIDGVNYNVTNDITLYQLTFPDLETAPLSFVPSYMYIITEYQPTYEMAKNFSDVLEDFEPLDTKEPEILKLLDIQMNNTQIAMALVLLAISAANCCLCYNFINESRRKTYAIFKLCGAKDYHCLIISLVEVGLYTAVGCLVSYCLFENFLKDILIGYYPNITGLYSQSLYTDIFQKYAIITLAIMLVSLVRFATTPIVEQRK